MNKVYYFDSLLGKPKKTLFIKNLPSSTTEAQIRALSPDIQSVRLESSKKSGEANPKLVIDSYSILKIWIAWILIFF
jgi:RNA recognition motif-containing protein